MQELKLHDKVLLNSGEIAYISKVYRQGAAYRAMIHTVGGPIAGTILHRNIVKVYPLHDAGRDRYAG